MKSIRDVNDDVIVSMTPEEQVKIRKALDNLFRLFKDERLVGLSLEDRKVIVGIDEILDIPSRYREEYMMLGRLQSDCEYYLHDGGRNPKFLWAQDEADSGDAQTLRYPSGQAGVAALWRYRRV